ncbi:hypothetical protein P8452_32540 [Trifolium repens]|nr:hypothetical protein P8452_32540 [Trifolium repens]
MVEEQAIEHTQDQDTIMANQDTPAQTSDRGKSVVVETTPSASPVRPLLEFGIPSTTITHEMRTVFDGMQAQINQSQEGMQSQQSDLAEIKADNKAKDEKMDHILSFLKELAERLPSKN